MLKKEVELARSVARQIKSQMDLRGRFQSVDRDVVLAEVREVGENVRELYFNQN